MGTRKARYPVSRVPVLTAHVPVQLIRVSEFRVTGKAGSKHRVPGFICSNFNFNDYLYRHALCVLNYDVVEEIHAKYIMSRRKKDYKRLYVLDNNTNIVDINDQIQ